MSFCFAFIFLIFSSLFLPVQAQVLIPGPNLEYDFNQFDWQAFVTEENIQKSIDFRNQGFHYFGPNINTLNFLNFNKMDLVRLEQELSLYEQEIKEGLSYEEIEQAKEAIRLHRENISSIEGTILQEGLMLKVMGGSTVVSALASIEAVRELYKGDQEIVFNLVEKTDEKLYSALGNDEDYAKLILPQVEQYTKKMGIITQSYYDSLWSSDQVELNESYINNLMRIHSSSLEIYKCFLKNFQNPEGGEHQQKLKETIESWYGLQSQLGAGALISAYQNGIRTNPSKVSRGLHDFQSTLPEVKVKIANFYRNDFLNNPAFKNSDSAYVLGARVDALIGLKYLDQLNEQEQELFNKALEQGVIRRSGTDSFIGSIRPLP